MHYVEPLAAMLLYSYMEHLPNNKLNICSSLQGKLGLFPLYYNKLVKWPSGASNSFYASYLLPAAAHAAKALHWLCAGYLLPR